MDWKKVVSNTAKMVNNKNKNTTYSRYPQSGGKKKTASDKKQSRSRGGGQCGGAIPGEETVEVGSSTLTFMTLVCIIGMIFMMGLVIYLLWKNNTINVQENMNDMAPVSVSSANGGKVDLNIRIRNDDPDIPNPNLISYPELVV